ncbi:ABC transporter permease [Microbacterium sp.]|uniref:ABC transporter permease n=1 Tax=Microbacterium sp. TaxID=51671 RepID=UPI0028AB9240|nr:ABC transporter permease [Microbacterium sp.]
MTARFIGQRVLFGVALLIAASFLVFLLTKLAPGGAEYAILGGKPTSAEALEAVRERYHLNDPWLVQYWRWLSGVLTGDFGRSFITGERVVDTISMRIAPTLQLTGSAALVSVILGVPLGVLAGLTRNTVWDRVITAGTIALVAVPSFVLAIFLVYVFSVQLGWFPSFGIGETGADRAYHLFLPVTALGVSGMGIIVRLTRAAVIEELQNDSVMFARSRGLSGRRILLNYAVRNALVPVVTAVGLILVGLVAGAVFIETVFSVPGMGTALVNAVKMRDMPLIQGVVLLISAWVVITHILVDIAYVFIDPRIGFGRAGH